MVRAAVNGIEIDYETFGSADWPAMVLISGAGAAGGTFHDDFCRRLVDRGYYVIRHDNRDAGLSARVESGGYSLGDMADDTSALLDSLAISRAHVVGMSLGGTIAQMVAIRHPFRILSLTSIMPTGAPGIGGVTDTAGESDEPAAVERHLQAVEATGDLTEFLRRLDVPALMIHDSDDPLVQTPGDEPAAGLVPGAEVLVIEGLVDGLPQPAWDRVIEAIDRLASRSSVSP